MGSCPECSRGRKIPTQRRRLSRLTGLQGFGMLAPPRQDGMHWKGIPLCQGPRHRQDAGPGLFLSTRTTPARRSVGSGRVPRSGLVYTWGAARAQADALQRTRLPSDRGGFGVAQPARPASHPVRKGLEDGARQRLWPSDDSPFAWSALPAQIGRREQAVPTPDCDRAAGPGAPATTRCALLMPPLEATQAGPRHVVTPPCSGEACPADDPWPPGRLQRGR